MRSRWLVLLTRPLLAAVALALAAVPAAAAKGPASGQLCGSSGCVALDAEGLEPFSSWWFEPFTERPAPKPAPFFRVVVRQSAPDGLTPITWTLLYAPQRSAMRIAQSRVPPYTTGIGPYWRTVPATARAALARVTARVRAYPASAAWARCRVTDVRGRRPPDPALPSFNYGNAKIRVSYFPEDGHLVAGRLPGGGWRATIGDDGSIDAKFGWWRAGSGKIRISGRRLDAPAPPLSAHVPDGYSAGFQATGLTFPTTGCWRVTGRYGRASLTFTMLVTKSPLGP